MADSETPFIYIACQHGIEGVVKAALCEPHGHFRLAYSQKGFITLKADESTRIWSIDPLRHPFVRASGQAWARLEGEQSDVLIDEALRRSDAFGWEAMHVWERDAYDVGWNGFEPGASVLASSIAEQFREKLRAAGDARAESVNQETAFGRRVLDIILVQPNLWWLGTHRVTWPHEQWPGGIPNIQPPPNMISRAYLKIAEAVLWSQLPFQPGDAVVEIGSAPGGACQYLLKMGMRVTGIDPGEMAPSVLAHPRFQHIRARSPQVKRKVFQDFRWLICDANVAPNYVLETVEHIVQYPTTRLEGLILTIKLLSEEQAYDCEQHQDRVRSWGFRHVQARQLAHHRREYCLAAHR